MSHTRSRIVGSICLILGILLALLGLLSRMADTEGSPLYAAYHAADEERRLITELTAALASAPELIARANTLPGEVLEESNATLAAAEQSRSDEQSGRFDPETDTGVLGQAIYDAAQSGAELSAVTEAFSPVLNRGLLDTLSTNLTDVKRAEGAVTDAEAALDAVIAAAGAIDPDAAFPELPILSEAKTEELGERKGIERYLARARNYIARSENAVANAARIDAASTELLETASGIAKAHPLSTRSGLLFFAHTRWADLTVYGAVLLLIGACLVCLPAWLAARWKVSLFRKGTIFAFTVAVLAAALHYADGDLWDMMRQGVFDTLYMTIPSTFFAYVVGLPLGVLLVITSPGHIRSNPTLNNAVGTVINFLRSIPFVILLVMLFDVTRIVMGTAIGTRSVIFPLFVSAFPYVARIVESSLNEVDRGVIEAAQSMGSTDWQIIRKVLLPEALPSLINGAAICVTTVLAYTAMAGSAGGDGLGKIAIAYGLNRREYDIMYISSLLLVALVQIFQIAGDILTRAVDHRKK